MGIPKFFRWLSDRYPLVNQQLDETHVFDHFYLDMNGIIHQCTHPNDNEVTVYDVDLMFQRICDYTERLYHIVAPRKLLYLAVDGVAPRAKMNQQRSRRFLAARDAQRTVADSVARGDDLPNGVLFDSNCITPGTKFMADLSVRFRKWVEHKMRNDYSWQQGCDIVFSGSEVPGEGEHKIIEWIRTWKASDKYDPTVRHCMYGLDADLIMLGLVVHTPHFTLLREKIKWESGKRAFPKVGDEQKFDADEFQLLEVALLRDMLFLEFKNAFPLPPRGLPSASPMVQSSGQVRQKPFRLDADRIVDDFVFMCMLVGNDFIPNIPHLDIAEGALALLFRTYKALVPRWRGYLTDAHRLHPARLESFFKYLAEQEFTYFKARGLEEGVKDFRDPEKYRAEYYQSKFCRDINGEDADSFIKGLRLRYLEGLHWVLQYYHNGCPSWNWFYPDFYAPLASDMRSLRGLRIRFQKGRPFPPLTQLLAVLPPESSNLLPSPFQEMMVGKKSSIADFYPREFTVDPNGKRNSWEAVVLVPFIDEKRLVAEVEKVDLEKELDKSQLKRNRFGADCVWLASDYPHSRRRLIPVRTRSNLVGRTDGSVSEKRSTARDNGNGRVYVGRSIGGTGRSNARGRGRGIMRDSIRGRGGGGLRGRFRGRGRGNSRAKETQRNEKDAKGAAENVADNKQPG